MVWHENRQIGDVNGDGRFDSFDLTAAFNSGKYDEDLPNNADFRSGDWNRDGDFDSDDLLFAFAEGHYDSGGGAAARDVAATVEVAFADDDERKSAFVA